jgi:ankyrin repeat protein
MGTKLGRDEFLHRLMAREKHRRRWLQFSTKALLALVFVVSVPFSWVAYQRAQRNREKRVAIEIEKLGGSVRHNWSEDEDDSPPGPPWLRAMLGDDFFTRVEGVDLSSKSDLTDADIPDLETLVDLEDLSLERSCASDIALSHLAGLKRLTSLNLRETRTTDRGTPWIKALRRLERLDLTDTLVTAAGIAELQSALPNCKILRYDRSDEAKYQGLLPIHSAAVAGDVETIRAELAAGVPVDLRVKTKEGTTPLMWASSRGQADAVRLLIASGADVNAKNSDGTNSLMIAAGAIRTTDGDPLACVRVLLEAGADVEQTDNEQRTALFYACGKGAFFDEPPNAFLAPELRAPDPFPRMRPDAIGNFGAWGDSLSARLEQLRHGDPARLAKLLDAHADVNATSRKEFNVLMAAASTDVQRLRLLLDAGADPRRRSAHNGNALWVAADGGTYEMFMTLVEAGLKREPGLLACAAGSDVDAAEKVQWLISDGADVDEADARGQTPLIAALWFGSSTAAPVLLRAGANDRIRDGNGESMLLYAARFGQAEAVRLLLERGLDPHERSNEYGHATALILAAESRRESGEKVHLLIAAGADIEATSDPGDTALLAASRSGNMQAVVVLAEAGANVNIVAPERHEMTPLMNVANRGDIDDPSMCEQTGGRAARALIELGANVHATNEYGHTARRLAEITHHDEVLEVLDEFGG